jgi:succinate dehydrogenase / fumarate reductase membrane anchor subunit
MGMNTQTVFRAGVRDWLVQRATALIMIAYIATMIVWLSMHQYVTYTDWSALFHCTFMRVFTIIFTLSLCLHAWVGVWTVLTDYVNHFALRMTLFLLVQLALLAYFIWAIQILWGV